MKNFLLLLFLAFAAFSCRAQAVYQLSVLPVCWNYAENADSTLYAYWLMSSRQEEPRLMSYLNVAGQVVSVAPGSLSPGPCCCDGGSGGNLDSLSIGVVQDSIIVLYNAGVEISRDTVYFAPGSPVSLDTCSVARVVEVYDPTWTARTAPNNGWSKAIYGNGLFVAVASNGTDRVMTSPDGITWTARTAAEANNWNSVAYGNGTFVAVSNGGTNRVMTSPDGITWTARALPQPSSLISVTYGNGLFVAVALISGIVMTSPDGITWTARPAPNNSWFSVAYGNGMFVAVSNSGTYRVMTSPDGITWTARTAAEANSWRSVTYGNGLFVAISSSGTNRVMTSPDGITWTARSAPIASWSYTTYGNGVFVAVTNAAATSMWSADGITWTQINTVAGTWNGLAYGNGLFVGVSGSTPNYAMTSGFTTQIQCPENPYGGDNTMQGIIDSLYENITTGGGGGIDVIASNGLNDADPSGNVDVELGGMLERNTTVTGEDYTYGMVWDSLSKHEVYTGNALGEVWQRILGNSFYQYRTNDSIVQLFDMVNSAGTDRILLSNRNTNTNNSSGLVLETNEISLAVNNPGLLNNSIGFGAMNDEVYVKTRGTDQGTVDTGYVLTLVELSTGKAEYRPVTGGGAGNGIFNPSNDGGVIRISTAALNSAFTIAGTVDASFIFDGLRDFGVFAQAIEVEASDITITAGDALDLAGDLVTVTSDDFRLPNLTVGASIGDVLTLNALDGSVGFSPPTGGGATNLDIANRTATTLDVTSSTGTDATVPAATTSQAGLLTAADKTKLDGLTPGGTNLSTTNLTQTDGTRTYTFTSKDLSFLGGNNLLLQSTALNVGRAGQAQTAAIPTLSPQGATLSNDPTGFIRVLNWNGTLAGTGYRSINDLFSLVIRDQFLMQSTASTAITTTRYNSATPLALSGVPTSLQAGYAFQSSLLNRGYVGLSSNNVTTLTGNGQVLVEGPSGATLKSGTSTITADPSAIQLTVTGSGVIVISGVQDYFDQSSAAGLAPGTLYSVQGALYIAQ